MSRSPEPFHVQHLARPEHIERILVSVPTDQEFDPEWVHSRLAGASYSVTRDAVRRSLDMGSKLGLFGKRAASGGAVRLAYVVTPRGRSCRSLAQYRPEVFHDVMHFLLVSTWESGGHKHYWSWSYAQVCETLWLDRPRVARRRALFGRLSAEAAEAFPELNPVVGTETIGAVTNWLRELSPPFLVTDADTVIGSQEREWFSVELALLAVSYLYTRRGVATGMPLLLDADTLALLGPLCLASPDSISALIEIASRTFAVLDIHTGEWGSSAILKAAIDCTFFD